MVSALSRYVCNKSTTTGDKLMEPTSRYTAREVLKYLYEQGLLSSAYNEDTEVTVLNDVQNIIKDKANLSC